MSSSSKPNHWYFIDIALLWSCDLLSVDLQGNHYGEIPPLVTQANSKGGKNAFMLLNVILEMIRSQKFVPV